MSSHVQKGSSTEAPADSRRWLALILLCAAQFMVVLDISIVNVALLSMQHELGFSTQNLQWVISAYSLTFGGFLLLGGRAADLFGRRRLLIAGLMVFSLASLLGGLSQSPVELIVFRAIQGLGAALVATISLSLIAILFAEGPERNTALGIAGAVASSGFAAGAILGGLLTTALGWRWVLFVNVPIGMLAVALAPFWLRESRASLAQRHVDVQGALLVTGGLVALVFALVEGNTVGWVSLAILGLFALAIVLLVAFVFVERRSPAPLVRLGVFRLRSLTGANLVAVLATGAFGSLIFVLTLYMQEVLHFSPLSTGLGFLPLAALLILTSNVASWLITRWGVKPVMVSSLLLMIAGSLLLLGLSAQGTYLSTLFPGMLVFGLGISPLIASLIISATAGVGNDEQGLATGLFNTSQQVGAGLGLAVIVVISTIRTASVAQGGAASAVALSDGFQAALIGCACLVVIALLIALLVIQSKGSNAALAAHRAPASPAYCTRPLGMVVKPPAETARRTDARTNEER